MEVNIVLNGKNCNDTLYDWLRYIYLAKRDHHEDDANEIIKQLTQNSDVKIRELIQFSGLKNDDFLKKIDPSLSEIPEDSAVTEDIKRKYIEIAIEEINQKNWEIQKDYYQELINLHSEETRKLIVQFEHIEKLIGRNHHGPTEGYHCELLLKEYLRAHLPKNVSVDTGFIRTNPIELNDDEITLFASLLDGQRCVRSSKQIDILVHEENLYSPIYRTGDCVIVVPESVKAVIEVKKKMTTNELEESIEKFAYNNYLLYKSSNCRDTFWGIISYVKWGDDSNSEEEDDNKRHYFAKNNLRENLTEWHEKYKCLPDIICSLKDFVIIINKIRSGYDVWYLDSISQSNKLNITLAYFMYKIREITRLGHYDHFYEFPMFQNIVDPKVISHFSIP